MLFNQEPKRSDALGYDDGPTYEWSHSFRFVELYQVLQEYNEEEINQFSTGLMNCGLTHEDLEADEVYSAGAEEVSRIALMRSSSDAMGPSGKGDVVLPLFVPQAIFHVVNELHQARWAGSLLPLTPALKEQNQLQVENFLASLDVDLMPVFWRLDGLRVWQMVERRVDECVAFLLFIY